MEDRFARVLQSHHAGALLTPDNPEYKQWIFRYTFLELEKDLGQRGDITTSLLFPGDTRRITGRIVSGEDGLIAGLQELRYFLMESDPSFRPRLREPFELAFHYQDGDSVKSGSTVLTLSGLLADVLAIERVTLNLLMRMSGVATYTRSLCNLIGNATLLCPTRKTLWGLLDKRAVSLGGGGTHRLSLSDAVLIKDNHLTLLGAPHLLSERILTLPEDVRFVEVEASSDDEISQVAEFFSRFLLRFPQRTAVMMFDNISPAKISRHISELRAVPALSDLLFEASGGITPKTLTGYAESGVDIISMGALTYAAPSIDMSLVI